MRCKVMEKGFYRSQNTVIIQNSRKKKKIELEPHKIYFFGGTNRDNRDFTCPLLSFMTQLERQTYIIIYLINMDMHHSF